MSASTPLLREPAKYFVYTKGLRGPAPEMWYEDLTRGTDGFIYKAVGEPDSILLYFRALEGDDRYLSFEQLKEKFPYIENFVYTGRK